MGSTRNKVFGGVAALSVTTAMLGGSALTAKPEAKAPPAETGPRSFRTLSDEQLWDPIDSGGQTAVVGLKAPGTTSGLQQGRVVLDPAGRDRATDAVLAQRGVSLLSADQVRPAVKVKLQSRQAMEAVRALPYVEYVEPASFTPQVLDMGCTGNAWNGSTEGGTVYTGPKDVDPAMGDQLVRPFVHSKVPDAWKRGATGQGITVGVVDTGTFPMQTQLYDGQFGAFATGLSTGRTARHFNTSGSGYGFDDCNHGTRVASVVAAPRDGTNMVGVAYKSNLVTVRGDEDVAIMGWETGDVAAAIRSAADNGSRIITMAFGTGSWSFDNIKHEIEHQHHVNGRLFVGAAGTLYCNEGVVFPAKMPEVLAVTGASADGRLHPDACGGPEVDIAAVIDNSFAAGKRPSDLITFGGSSAATSMVSGIAALTWSENPNMSRDQVRDRILRSGSQCCSSGMGWGVVNAYKAVGGFAALGISGPRTVAPSTTYTLSATPQGDGPFAYRWSTGETTKSITKTTGTNGTAQTFSVTVTDLRENKALSSSVTVTSADPEPSEPIYECRLKYCE